MAMQCITAIWIPNVVIADNKRECVCDMIFSVMQLRIDSQCVYDTDGICPCHNLTGLVFRSGILLGSS